VGANQNTNKNINISALIEQTKSIEAADRELMLEEINLPIREEKFAHAYAAYGSLTKAAIATGSITKKASRTSINKTAHYYWKKPLVRRRVRQILLPMLLDFDITAYKIVSELIKIANSDITDFVGVKKIPDPITGYMRDKVYIKNKSLKLLRKMGDTTVIKEISQRKDGSISVKLHDKAPAQNKLTELLFNTMTNLQKTSTETKANTFADLLKLPAESESRKEFEKYLMSDDGSDKKQVIVEAEFVEVGENGNLGGEISEATKSKLLLDT